MSFERKVSGRGRSLGKKKTERERDLEREGRKKSKGRTWEPGEQETRKLIEQKKRENGGLEEKTEREGRQKTKKKNKKNRGTRRRAKQRTKRKQRGSRDFRLRANGKETDRGRNAGPCMLRRRRCSSSSWLILLHFTRLMDGARALLHCHEGKQGWFTAGKENRAKERDGGRTVAAHSLRRRCSSRNKRCRNHRRSFQHHTSPESTVAAKKLTDEHCKLLSSFRFHYFFQSMSAVG